MFKRSNFSIKAPQFVSNSENHALQAFGILHVNYSDFSLLPSLPIPNTGCFKWQVEGRESGGLLSLKASKGEFPKMNDTGTPITCKQRLLVWSNPVLPLTYNDIITASSRDRARSQKIGSTQARCVTPVQGRLPFKCLHVRYCYMYIPGCTCHLVILYFFDKTYM